MSEEVVVEEVTEVHEGRMRTSGPEGAPNMVGTWLPQQIANRGGVLREDTGVPIEAVLHSQSGRAAPAGGVRAKVAGAGGRRIAVVRGSEARKGIEALMRRYG